MEIKFKLDMVGLKNITEEYRKKLETAVEESIQETPATAIIQEEYDKSDLRVRSGNLYHSFKEEKNKDSMKVATNVVYARIHDQGGYNGRNYRSYQRPRYYFTRASERIKTFLKTKILEKMKK